MPTAVPARLCDDTFDRLMSQSMSQMSQKKGSSVLERVKIGLNSRTGGTICMIIAEYTLRFSSPKPTVSTSNLSKKENQAPEYTDMHHTHCLRDNLDITSKRTGLLANYCRGRRQRL